MNRRTVYIALFCVLVAFWSAFYTSLVPDETRKGFWTGFMHGHLVEFPTPSHDELSELASYKRFKSGRDAGEFATIAFALFTITAAIVFWPEKRNGASV